MSFLNLARDLYLDIYGCFSDSEKETNEVDDKLESFASRLEKAYQRDGWLGIVQEEEKIKKESRE